MKETLLDKDLFVNFFKTVSLFFLTILILFVFTPISLTQEPMWPQKDFDLISGVYRINNPSDPAPIDKEYQIIFANTFIQVRDGKFSESQNTGISFRMSEAQKFTGSGSLTISGAYDKETGKISGDYKIFTDVSSVYQLEGETWRDEGWSKMTESGSFQGQVINDYVVLNLRCKTAGGEYYYKGSRKEERKLIDKCSYFFHKVAFRVTPVVPVVKSPDKEKINEEDYIGTLYEFEEEGKYTKKPLIDSEARFAGLTGQVDIIFNGVRRPAKMGDVIPAGALIVTEEDSRALISFIDMSIYEMKPESQIMLHVPKEEPLIIEKLKLVAGKIKVNVKKMLKDGTMEIEMNQAVAGIKGTTFVCEEKDGKSVLKVIDGTVDFKSKATGETVKVGGGEMVEADAKGLSKVDKFDIAEESDSWIKLNKIDWEKLDKESPQNIPVTEQVGKEAKAKSYWLWLLIVAVIAAAIVSIGFKFIKNKKLKKQ